MLRVEDDQKGVCGGRECPQRLPEPLIQCDMSKEMSNGFGSFSLPRARRDVHRLPGQDYTTVKE